MREHLACFSYYILLSEQERSTNGRFGKEAGEAREKKTKTDICSIFSMGFLSHGTYYIYTQEEEEAETPGEMKEKRCNNGLADLAHNVP